MLPQVACQQHPPALLPCRLALVEVELVPGALLQGADLAAHPDAKLVLRAPGMAQELQVLAACCLTSWGSPGGVWGLPGSTALSAALLEPQQCQRPWLGGGPGRREPGR